MVQHSNRHTPNCQNKIFPCQLNQINYFWIQTNVVFLGQSKLWMQFKCAANAEKIGTTNQRRYWNVVRSSCHMMNVLSTLLPLFSRRIFISVVTFVVPSCISSFQFSLCTSSLIFLGLFVHIDVTNIPSYCTTILIIILYVFRIVARPFP